MEAAPIPSTDRSQRVLGLLAAVVLGLLAYRAYSPRFGARPTDYAPATDRRVDVNTADRTELLQIPGVGPSLADAILVHRATAGPFESLDDLQSVKGIGAKTLDKLRPWLTAPPAKPQAALPETVERLERKPTTATSSGSAKKPDAGSVNINTANAAELQRLPGIGPKLAERILAARQVKPFDSADDLKRVGGIGVKTIEKLRSSVVVK